jgi:ribonuclease Y
MLLIAAYLVTGLAFGILGPLVGRSLQRKRSIRLAQEMARQIVEAAGQRAQDVTSLAQKRAQEVETRIRQRYQKEVANRQTRLKDVDEELREKRSQADREYSHSDRDVQKLTDQVNDRLRRSQERQHRYSEQKQNYLKLKSDLIERLLQISQASASELKERVFHQIEQQIHVDARKMANEYEEDVRANAEEISKKILSNVLARFPREYCSERGIGVVQIPSEDVRNKLIANDRDILKAVEALCGVDVSIQDETHTLAVSGFDPVRRELTTRSLEKLVSERQITREVVQRIVEKTKRDVFQRIEEDGRRLAKELGQQNFHPEVQSMLGALRYRYSFAQNQHFHVGEVGWLCGLLASEIGEHIPSAKRAGLLHDIGKAMDHSIEGGHAVIGADFIQERGEAAHVVHAVRAHHFEEQPQTDLAFLVIAADAISGARPGARRSTVSSYNQKMEVLETIADGFNGVNKTLVFNAGREVRVIVDGHRVNDEQSLVLCRQIADKIEAELTYPGQIKVVVVRETHAEAIAK